MLHFRFARLVASRDTVATARLPRPESRGRGRRHRVACAALCILTACADTPPTSLGVAGGSAVAATVANVAPTTAFAVSPRFPLPGDTVTVDGTYSHDVDGQVVRYRWSFGNGIDQNTSAVARTVYTRSGTYSLTLITTDDSGDSASVTLPHHRNRRS